MSTALIVLKIVSSGQLVLQRRDDKTNIYPNMLTFFGGSIEPGETPLEAANREINEEISLHTTPNQLRSIGSFKLKLKGKGFRTFHLFRREILFVNFQVNEGLGAEVYTQIELLQRNDVAEITRIIIRRCL